ncbi:hypothetical protein PFISCL1PPCAC_18478, partial [Pristionchus fissidentatus]
VDAHFGSLKRKLDVVDVFTPTEMATVLESIGYTSTEFINYTYNIKESISDMANHYKDRHLYHHFRIYRDDGGDVKFDADYLLDRMVPFTHHNVLKGLM